MLLRYCRIARISLVAHGMLLQCLRMVSPHCNQWSHHIATKWKLFCKVAEMFYVGWVTTSHTNTACKVSELKEQRHNLHKKKEHNMIMVVLKMLKIKC